MTGAGEGVEGDADDRDGSGVKLRLRPSRQPAKFTSLRPAPTPRLAPPVRWQQDQGTHTPRGSTGGGVGGALVEDAFVVPILVRRLQVAAERRHRYPFGSG
jgi:hypothetical protein